MELLIAEDGSGSGNQKIFLFNFAKTVTIRQWFPHSAKLHSPVTGYDRANNTQNAEMYAQGWPV
jgi:hypothetical protein